MKMSSKRKKKKKGRTLESNSCTVNFYFYYLRAQSTERRKGERESNGGDATRRIAQEKNERTRSASVSNGFYILPVTIITRYEL